MNVKIIGVVTQGRAQKDEWVTLFKIGYEKDGFIEFKNNQFEGNVDRNSMNDIFFNEVILTQAIRIKILEWHNHISLRLGVHICPSNLFY